MCNKHRLIIKQVRLSKRMKQSKIAKLAGISTSYLSEIEHNVKSPSFAVTCKIATALEVCVKDLILCNCDADKY